MNEKEEIRLRYFIDDKEKVIFVKREQNLLIFMVFPHFNFLPKARRVSVSRFSLQVERPS